MNMFPFAFLTWRESIVGFQPTEMNFMQIEHNWVSASKPGYRNFGAGYAMGENLGNVKWRMFDHGEGRDRLRTLHSEAYDQKTDTSQIEDIVVDPLTNRIVSQNEKRNTPMGTVCATSLFFEDRVEIHRLNADGRTVIINLYPPDGMDWVQRRFEPMPTGSKDFLIVDGVEAKFRLVHAELSGRFAGNWGPDKYKGNAYRFTIDGKEQTVMLTKYGEIVKIALGREYSIALMGQPPSHRYEEQRRGLFWP